MKKNNNYNWIIVGLFGVLFVLSVLVWLVYSSTVQFTDANGIDRGSIYSNFSATITGSLIAGILTLIGVVLTIMHYKQSDYTQQRLQHMPYIQVSFGKWVTSKERGTNLPDMFLSIGRAAEPDCPCSGKSVELTNIGLGMAVNLKCKWYSGEGYTDHSFSSSLLKIDESCTSSFIISADVPTGDSQCTETKLIICFDDFIGNHYEQVVDMTFEIHQTYISLVQYVTEAPQYIK